MPEITVILIGNHKVGKPIKCLIDTGSTANIFPWEYGTVFIGFSDKFMRKGTRFPIIGVGGKKTEGNGHKCTIQNPDFEIKNVMIYFVKDQPYALLGRVGFMDKFKKIIIDEENKHFELIK